MVICKCSQHKNPIVLKYPRLALAMQKAYPWHDLKKIHHDILYYQHCRKEKMTDWEGERAFFQKVIRMCLQKRR